MTSDESLFRIRTITYFVSLDVKDFEGINPNTTVKLSQAAIFLHKAKDQFESKGYTVQTLRIATNPFGLWFQESSQLDLIDSVLAQNDIQFCSLGPADKPLELPLCLQIIKKSSRFSCSANLLPNDVVMATECAKLVREELTQVQDGLGNFRFCVAACAKPYIPFFPVAKATAAAGKEDQFPPCCFAIGLENGSLAHKLLTQTGSLHHVPTIFAKGMTRVLDPLQGICQALAADSCNNIDYAGIDTSLNPSLDNMTSDHPGSIAGAIETLDEVERFGGPGTLAAAAAITTALQSLPGIKHCGYSGIMLPVCEDKRLAELSESSTSLSIANLLSISHVCGVGVDTVPVPGNASIAKISSLFLDVAGMAHRWNKSLSCRIFPVNDRVAGEKTSFDSPYMVNASVLALE